MQFFMNFRRRFAPKIASHASKTMLEAETLSCGTGVTASAIVAASAFEMESPITIETQGGQLFISFVKEGPTSFSDIYLAGTAIKVFEGSIDV